MAKLDMMRPVGALEKMSTARHHLGLYRSVAVTGTYRCEALGRNSLYKCTFWKALSAIIPRHPALCCGIIGEETSEPAFVRLKSIDLRDNVLLGRGEAGNDELLTNRLEEEHSKLWPDLHCRPGWKVVIMTPEKKKFDARREALVDVIFLYHHALADGMSGTVFHASLLEQLRTPDPNYGASDWPSIVEIPDTVQLLPPIEDLTDFPLSKKFMAQQLLENYVPSWLLQREAIDNPKWIKMKDPMPSIDGYISRIRLLTIPKDTLGRLLVVCREAKVTLTGLLHGVIGISLIELGADCFSASTPYNMRLFTGTSAKEIVNQVSKMDMKYSRKFVINLLKAPKESERIWSIAKHFCASMEDELSRAPKDNLLGMLPFVSNYHQFYRNKLGKMNGTYEISNLGAFRPPPLPTTHWTVPFTIDRMIFSSCAMVVGAPLGFSCISVRDGPLVISLAWVHSVIDNSQVEALICKVESQLKLLAA